MELGGGPIPGTGIGGGPESIVLRVLNGPKAGTIIRLDRPILLVGRSQPPILLVDIDLSECQPDDRSTVHRRHAEISWSGSNLRLVDLGGANGTKVNGRQVGIPGSNQPSEEVVIQPGDLVVFANVEVEVTNAEPG